MLKLVACFVDECKDKTQWMADVSARCLKIQVVRTHSLRPCLYLDYSIYCHKDELPKTLESRI